MRRLTAVVASGLLLGGVVMTSPAAWAHSGSNGLDDFKLTGEFTDFDFDDTGKDGPSEGDTVTFAMDLFDEDGDEAGDGDGTCELTDVNRSDHEFSADCESVFHLDDGDLEMEGEVTDEDFKNREVTQDITGGSDDYDDASGTVTFTPAGDKGGHHGHRHSSGYEAQHAGSHGGGGHGGGGHGDGGHGDGGHGDHKVDIDVDFD